MKYTPFGVDIAKHLMQIHFVDEYTGEVIDKQLRRNDFLTFFSNRAEKKTPALCSDCGHVQ